MNDDSFWNNTIDPDADPEDLFSYYDPLELNETYKSSTLPSSYYGFYWTNLSNEPEPASFTVTFQTLNDDDTCGPKPEFGPIGPICPIDTPANTLLPDCPIGANHTKGSEDGALPDTL